MKYFIYRNGGSMYNDSEGNPYPFDSFVDTLDGIKAEFIVSPTVKIIPDSPVELENKQTGEKEIVEIRKY